MVRKEPISNLPKHIGIIMDGNGRWALQKGLPREYGHREGAKTFKKIVEYCISIGIEAVTVYAFSTENWKRPKIEIDAIMKLLNEYIDDAAENFINRDVSLNFIGDKTLLSKTITDKMITLENKSRDRKFKLNIAVNYGGRDEIVHAVNNYLKSHEGKNTLITSDDISNNLYTCHSPDLDLLIRTGNEFRLSNFMLWQLAYTELYFSEVLWPDFSEKDIDLAIENFSLRKRRFGGVNNA